MLDYKAERAGKTVVRIAPHFTSQDCSRCGERVPKKLADRVHHCPHCGLERDRDFNAALNILYKAVVSLGTQNVAGYGKRAARNLDGRNPN